MGIASDAFSERRERRRDAGCCPPTPPHPNGTTRVAVATPNWQAIRQDGHDRIARFAVLRATRALLRRATNVLTLGHARRGKRHRSPRFVVLRATKAPLRSATNGRTFGHARRVKCDLLPRFEVLRATMALLRRATNVGTPIQSHAMPSNHENTATLNETEPATNLPTTCGLASPRVPRKGNGPLLATNEAPVTGRGVNTLDTAVRSNVFVFSNFFSFVPTSAYTLEPPQADRGLPNAPMATFTHTLDSIVAPVTVPFAHPASRAHRNPRPARERRCGDTGAPWPPPAAFYPKNAIGNATTPDGTTQASISRNSASASPRTRRP